MYLASVQRQAGIILQLCCHETFVQKYYFYYHHLKIVYAFIVNCQGNYLTVPYKLIGYVTSNRIKSCLMVLSLGPTLCCKQSKELDVVIKRIKVMKVCNSRCSYNRN
jgi:hypothetical protein